ncbi:MAG TPA: hypothetical protein VKA27_10970 [Sunxiuqinia sp.]|nr:hypothetical protein [Sunxiuqinia sp.]
MKQLIISAIFIVIATLSGYSQDRIITWNNDTITCTILSTAGHYIRFQTEDNGVIKKGRMNRSLAKKVILSEESLTADSPKSSPNRLRISLESGSGLLIGSDENGRNSLVQMGLTQAQADDYYNQVEVGWEAKARAHYFITDEAALGLTFRHFNSNAESFVTLDPQDGNNLYHGLMSDDMYVNFVGASFLYLHKLTMNGKLRFSATIDAGLTLYRDETTVLESSFLLTGKAYGSSADFGLEYFVLRHVSLGLDANLFLSTIHKVTYKDASTTTTQKLDNDNLQGLSSLDLLLGLKIYL